MRCREPLTRSGRELVQTCLSIAGGASQWASWFRLIDEPDCVMVPGHQSSIPRPYRERAGWEGKQRELLRGESPVRAGVSRDFPGQRVGSSRAHNPKVAGSNPAPATKRTLGNPTSPKDFLTSRIARDRSIGAITADQPAISRKVGRSAGPRSAYRRRIELSDRGGTPTAPMEWNRMPPAHRRRSP